MYDAIPVHSNASSMPTRKTHWPTFRKLQVGLGPQTVISPKLIKIQRSIVPQNICGQNFDLSPKSEDAQILFFRENECDLT